VVTHCAAALWALGVSAHIRRLLEQGGEALPLLLAALKRATELPTAETGEAQRNQMQVGQGWGALCSQQPAAALWVHGGACRPDDGSE
jgi:hypothetical protein